jgi:hypothetical protein
VLVACQFPPETHVIPPSVGVRRFDIHTLSAGAPLRPPHPHQHSISQAAPPRNHSAILSPSRLRQSAALGDISNLSTPCGSATPKPTSSLAQNQRLTSSAHNTPFLNPHATQKGVLVAPCQVAWQPGGAVSTGAENAAFCLSPRSLPAATSVAAAPKGPVVCKSKVLARRSSAKRRGGYEDDDDNDSLQSVAPRKRAASSAASGTRPRAPPPPRHFVKR